MARLEAAVDTRTAELVAEATGDPVTPAVQVPTPDQARRVVTPNSPESTR